MQLPNRHHEWPVELRACDALGHDMWRLRCRLQADAGFAFMPGQHARVEFPGIGWRDYSIASTPADLARTHELEFHVRSNPGGGFHGLLERGVLKPGLAMRLRGPGGHMHLEAVKGPLVLIAGGSGLAPMLSIAQAAVEAGLRVPVQLLLGVRTAGDFYARSMLEALRVQCDLFGFACVADPRHVHATDAGVAAGAAVPPGLVTDLLPGHQALLQQAEVFVAGPPAMLSAVIARLHALGVAHGQIHADGPLAPAHSQPLTHGTSSP